VTEPRAIPAATETVPVAPKPSVEEWQAEQQARIEAQQVIERLAADQLAVDHANDPATRLMAVVRANLWWFRWVMLAGFIYTYVFRIWGV
jgi:hypothetical protein